MGDVIITGASRGIGAALARELASRPEGPGGRRLVLVARDETRLRQIADGATVVPGDLSTRDGVDALAAALLDAVPGPDATLVHNAGIWPVEKRITADGVEEAFAVNHLGPLRLTERLLDAGRLERMFVVSAGLMIKGAPDAAKTPAGDDFHWMRTYATTKLCFAIAVRDVADAHPDLDVAVIHPGVVRTDLGDRRGPLGAVMRLVKRRWEAPETTAKRLADHLQTPRWREPGAEPAWFVESERCPWPEVATDPANVSTVRAMLSAGAWAPASSASR